MTFVNASGKLIGIIYDHPHDFKIKSNEKEKFRKQTILKR